MAIGVYFNFENTTPEQYDEVCRKLNNGQLMTKLSDWPGGGCLEHAAWHEESGALGRVRRMGVCRGLPGLRREVDANPR